MELLLRERMNKGWKRSESLHTFAPKRRHRYVLRKGEAAAGPQVSRKGMIAATDLHADLRQITCVHDSALTGLMA